MSITHNFRKKNRIRNVKALANKTCPYSDLVGVDVDTLELVIFNLNHTTLIHIPVEATGKFVIPETVIEVGIEAFSRCEKLTYIHIHSNIEAIGCLAFSDCTGLESIYIDNTIPITLSPNSDVFLNVDKSSCTLYVPTGSKKAYQHADQWKEFKNITEIADFEVEKFHNFKFDNSKKAI